MYNKVFLIGNLVRDPELRYTPSGIPVAKFAIAVNRIKKGEVDFLNIVAWRRLAEICGEYLKKGRPVAIEGSLQLRKYKDKQGRDRTFTEVVAENMQMLGSKPKDAQSAPAVKKNSTEEDVPF
ncbi:MAG: single-stranded DNA-binding protein [Candidatus Saganbacteria bacterium]|nr:single-stranded DNA-binding protein [Candidatus Saganbacteria bacterium]